LVFIGSCLGGRGKKKKSSTLGLLSVSGLRPRIGNEEEKKEGVGCPCPFYLHKIGNKKRRRGNERFARMRDQLARMVQQREKTSCSSPCRKVLKERWGRCRDPSIAMWWEKKKEGNGWPWPQGGGGEKGRSTSPPRRRKRRKKKDRARGCWTGANGKKRGKVAALPAIKEKEEDISLMASGARGISKRRKKYPHTTAGEGGKEGGGEN